MSLLGCADGMIDRLLMTVSLGVHVCILNMVLYSTKARHATPAGVLGMLPAKVKKRVDPPREQPPSAE